MIVVWIESISVELFAAAVNLESSLRVWLPRTLRGSQSFRMLGELKGRVECR